MLRHPHAESSAPFRDFDSLPSPYSVFTVLNLFLLLVLWLTHTFFASFWGKPSVTLVAVLGASVTVRAGELLWLRRRALGLQASAALTWCSIGFNLTLAVLLSSIVDREDSQYAALVVVPILESAFRFRFRTTLAVATAADSIIFYWVWRYFQLHPPTKIGEYFEAGTLSIILILVAVLCSSMVRHLRRKEAQLEKVGQRLLQQEKMAAVGRLTSAVAHEIRNPVAMISSSLATARALDGTDRDQMLEIARLESSRLVTLTNDLLAYARPRCPVLKRSTLSDTAVYVADACRAHAEGKGVAIRIDAAEELPAEYDEGLLQQALMNLIINAVDASPAGAPITLAVKAAGPEKARIDVENQGGPIPDSVVERLFEPFITTKLNGTDWVWPLHLTWSVLKAGISHSPAIARWFGSQFCCREEVKPEARWREFSSSITNRTCGASWART